MPIQQHGGLLADQGGNCREYAPLPRSFDKVFDAATLSKILHGLAQVRTAGVQYMVRTELFGEFAFDLVWFAHQQQPVIAEAAPQILRKKQSRRASATDQNVAHALPGWLAVDGVTRVGARHRVRRM